MLVLSTGKHVIKAGKLRGLMAIDSKREERECWYSLKYKPLKFNWCEESENSALEHA